MRSKKGRKKKKGNLGNCHRGNGMSSEERALSSAGPGWWWSTMSVGVP